MADGFTGGFAGGGFSALLASYIGETVTIFTSSGGQSGSGFTGVVLAVNEVFVRLITRIGPPPGCSLGNACSGFNAGYGYGAGAAGAFGGGFEAENRISQNKGGAERPPFLYPLISGIAFPTSMNCPVMFFNLVII